MSQFLFDDFFVPADDPGIEDSVTVRGQVIPMHVAKGLSLRDVQEANAKAVRTRVDPATGNVEIVGVDQVVFAVEILVRAIKSWPFTMSDGTAVPVTRENLYALRADGLSAFKSIIERLTGSDTPAQLDPSEPPSVAA